VLRPIALREIAKRTPKNATNTEALLGVTALTRSEITEYSGEVDLRGEVWSARSVTGTIPAQHRVTVSKIDGAIAVVESAPSPSSAH